MATGGSMSRSVTGSSDVIYDFTCTPCTEDGKNAEAVTYCVDCDTSFCQTCAEHHNKLFKSHSQLDKTAMGNVAKQPKQTKGAVQLPNKECSEHPGNVIQMYCGSHGVVCCTVCIAVEHRSCNGVDFVPKLAKGILTSTERQGAKTALETLQRGAVQLKSEKIKELSELKTKKDDILSEITDLKTHLITRVTEIEKKSKEEVSIKYQEFADKINNDIDSLNDMLESAKKQIKCIEHNHTNESEMFIAVKDGQNLESGCNTKLQQSKDATIESLSFKYNEEVKQILDDVETFGTIQTTDEKRGPYNATLYGEYDVSVSDDKSPCNVFDICLLDNNQFIITDFCNSNIKRLDQTFCVTDTFKIEGPWGLCKTIGDKLAVTLCGSRRVIFVRIGTKLERTSSFSTGICCRGIKYNNNTLVISCGEFNQSGEVRIYRLSGSLLRTCKNDTTGKATFSFIAQLALSPGGSEIYICDTQNGLIILDSQGNKLSVVTDKTLRGAFGVCTGDKNKIFFCCRNSANVFQLSRRDAQLQEILTMTDGIHHPISVTFVESPKRLIVTSKNSNKIKVFNLT